MSRSKKVELWREQIGQPSQKIEKKLLYLKKRPFEGRTLSRPLIRGEMLFAKKLKELGLLKEHGGKYIDGI